MNVTRYLPYYTFVLVLSPFPSPPFSPGPEFGTEEDCIFVGMVTEDVDVSELVDTIAALGRDIEESGRVCYIKFIGYLKVVKQSQKVLSTIKLIVRSFSSFSLNFVFAIF